MIGVIAIASVCGLAAAAIMFLRRRRVGFSGLDNSSVSRQWLMEHQGDDHR
ncbi:MAG TPA: hypothetical protein VM032_04825 [Vicinamibacterales bacterium]|nr:hypothetical protein [Vicinamibacterales bacterium]